MSTNNDAYLFGAMAIYVCVLISNLFNYLHIFLSIKKASYKVVISYSIIFCELFLVKSKIHVIYPS